MTFDELHLTIADASWFTRLGEARGDCILAASTEEWQWLPTSREEPDPIHGGKLVRSSPDELSAIKHAMESLRSVPESVPSLRSGPHDYTIAAKGGVHLAARFAAREIANDVDGFWCEACRLLNQGSWPCGVTDDLQAVVW